MASYHLSVQVSTTWYSEERSLRKALRLQTRDAKQIANQGDISLEAEDNLVEIRSNEHSSGGTSPCVLYLDIFPGFESDLGLYGLEVVSEARNIEVYGESDGYIGTSKGCLSREGNAHPHCDVALYVAFLFREGVPMYICSYKFSSPILISRMSIKFLSLGGRPEFHLKGILLTFDVVKNAESSKQLQGQVDSVHPMVTDSSVENLPEELKALVSTLHHLNADRSSTSSRSQEKEIPSEMRMAMAMLRNVHGALNHSKKETNTDDSGNGSDKPDGKHEVSNDSSFNPDRFVTKEDFADLAKHFDEAINKLHKHIDDKFSQLLELLSKEKTEPKHV